jgi:hypothetical protein
MEDLDFFDPLSGLLVRSNPFYGLSATLDVWDLVPEMEDLSAYILICMGIEPNLKRN